MGFNRQSETLFGVDGIIPSRFFYRAMWIFVVFIYLFIIDCNISFAQKEDYNWIVGINLISFNTNPPIAVYNPTLSSVSSGHSTSISDYSGNLLFYLPYNIVYNFNNQAIFTKTLTPTADNISVIPYPAETGKYMLFLATIGSNLKLNAYILDMNANGGLGAVSLLDEIPIINLVYGISRKYNSSDYWMIWIYSDKIVVSEINSAGFGNSVNYPRVNSNPATISKIRISPDMTKFFFSQNGGLNVLDFNSEIGIPGNERKVLNSGDSFEFSRNSEYVYTAKIKSLSIGLKNLVQIYQHSMDALYSEIDFTNSEQLIMQDTLDYYPKLDFQLAPDDKIYISVLGTYLWTINNADMPFPLCTVNKQAIYLNGDKSAMLPNYFYYRACFACMKNCNNVTFKYSGVSAGSYLWNYGDSQTSTELNPTHTYANPGTYTVTLTVTYTDNSTQTISKEIEIYDNPLIPIIQHE